MGGGWAALEARLDAAVPREPLTFWWRDDDAGRDHPALQRLLDLAGRHGAPLALAVVPAWLDGAATARIKACRSATVVQHGYAHRNHAALGAKKIELGGGRGLDGVLDELRRGRARLTAAFGSRFVPLLVPPWNRIDPALVPRLATAGWIGLSVAGGRWPEPAMPRGLARLDVHLDPIDWRGHRGFVGDDAALGRLLEALDAEGGPAAVGMVSHHLDHDEAGWRFLDRLIGLLARHPRARLAGVGELLGTTLIPGAMPP